LDTDLKIILLDHQNNFVRTLKIMLQNFDILAISLSVLHNYFDSSTNYFFDPYPVKILDLSAKPSFLCAVLKQN